MAEVRQEACEVPSICCTTDMDFGRALTSFCSNRMSLVSTFFEEVLEYVASKISSCSYIAFCITDVPQPDFSFHSRGCRHWRIMLALRANRPHRPAEQAHKVGMTHRYTRNYNDGLIIASAAADRQPCREGSSVIQHNCCSTSQLAPFQFIADAAWRHTNKYLRRNNSRTPIGLRTLMARV
jgi:hypothetical protein